MSFRVTVTTTVRIELVDQGAAFDLTPRRTGGESTYIEVAVADYQKFEQVQQAASELMSINEDELMLSLRAGYPHE